MFKILFVVLFMVFKSLAEDSTLVDIVLSDTIKEQIKFSPIFKENKKIFIPDSLIRRVKTNPIFEVLISEKGNIESIEIIRSSECPTVDSIVISHLYSCSFEPAKIKEENIAIKIELEYPLENLNKKWGELSPQKQNDTLPFEKEIVIYGIAQKSEYPQYVLKKNLIFRIPGYSGDPIKMLEILPAVSQTVSNIYLTSALCVRGGDADDSRYFMNGIPLPRINHLGGLISIYNADGLQNIDFFPGDFGVRYGRAVGGVINLLPDTILTKKITGYGDISLLNGTATIKTFLPYKGNLFLSLRRSWIGDIIPLFTSDEDLWRMFFGDLNATVSFIPNDRNRLTFYLTGVTFTNCKKETYPKYIIPWDSTYYHVVDPRNYPDSISYLSAVSRVGPIDTVIKKDLRLGYDFLLSALQIETKLTNKLNNFFQLAIIPAQSYSKNFDTLYSKSYSINYFLREEIRWNSSNFDVISGIEINSLSLKRNSLPGYDPGSGMIDVETLSRRFKFINNKSGVFPYFAGYLESNIKLPSRWIFIPGIRCDIYPKLSYNGSLIPLFTPTQLYYPTVRYPLEISFRLNTRYLLTSQMSVYGFIGTFNKDTDPMYSYNPQPVRSSHYVSGFNWNNGNISLDFSFYFYRQWNIQEYVIEREEDGFYVSGVRTDGKGLSSGLELYFTYLKGEKILGVFSYSLSRSLRWNFDLGSYVPYEKDRLHNLKTVLTYKLLYGFEIGMGLRFSSGIPMYPTVKQIWYEDKGYFDFINYRYGKGEERYSPYLGWDIKISQKLWKNKLQWYIDLKNLNALFYRSVELGGSGVYYDYEKQKWIVKMEEEYCIRQNIYPSLGVRVNF